MDAQVEACPTGGTLTMGHGNLTQTFHGLLGFAGYSQ